MTEGEKGNGRVEMLHKDMQALAQQMQDGFATVNQNLKETNDNITQTCREHRREIYTEIRTDKTENIKEHKTFAERLGLLEAKMFKVGIVGAGLGFILGVVTTLWLQGLITGGGI